MSWSTAFGQMALCLLSPLVALWATGILMLLPIKGAPTGHIIVLAILSFFLFSICAAGRELRRGTILFGYAGTYAGVTVASVGIAYLIHSATFIDLDIAAGAVFFLMLVAIAGILLFIFVCGEEDSNIRSVEVQRGRHRLDAAASFLYADDQSVAASGPNTDRVYEPDFDDPGSVRFDFMAGGPNDIEDDDPDVYERYRAFTGEIPESEFDDTYTYDVRRPNRLPLKKESIFRKYFELQARTNQ